MAANGDVMLRVCGASGDELLRRIAARRAGKPLPVNDVRRVLRFGDFAALAPPAFVESAYLTLLGRYPDRRELARRLSDLEQGMRRGEVLARLALSAEGRARRPQLEGLALPALGWLGRAVDATPPALRRRARGLLGGLRRMRSRAASLPAPVGLGRSRLGREARRAYAVARMIPLVGLLAETFVDLVMLRRHRRERVRLRAELARLQQGAAP